MHGCCKTIQQPAAKGYSMLEQVMDKIYWKIAWLITGLLFGIAGSLMILSGAFCVDHFMTQGKCMM